MKMCADSPGQPSPGQAYQAAADFGIDLRELDRLLGLTPFERLLLHDRALDLILAMRKAGIHYYGFDPRPAENPDKP